MVYNALGNRGGLTIYECNLQVDRGMIPGHPPVYLKIIQQH